MWEHQHVYMVQTQNLLLNFILKHRVDVVLIFVKISKKKYLKINCQSSHIKQLFLLV